MPHLSEKEIENRKFYGGRLRSQEQIEATKRRARDYQWKNREKIRERRKTSNTEIMKRWRQKHHEEYNRYAREWRARNKDRINERRKELRKLRLDYFREKHRDYCRKHRLSTTIDGVHVTIRVEKRDRPNSCELCSKTDCHLYWHHWNDNDPSKGIWVCWHCHMFAEKVDDGLVSKYLKLKKFYDEA